MRIITIWWLSYDLVRLKFLGSFLSVSVNIFQIMFAVTSVLGCLASRGVSWSCPVHPGPGEKFPREAGVAAAAAASRGKTASSSKGLG